jgi:hypothetical protein
MTERYNATIKNIIVSYISRCRDWDKHLHEVSFALRSSVNESTKFTPAYLSTGRELRTPFDNLLGIVSPSSEVQQLGERMALIYDLARDNIVHSQELSMKIYNKNAKFKDFKVGDLVMYRTHFLSNASQGFTKKLAPRWEGPYVITEKVSNVVYDLCNVESNQVVNKAHGNDLTPFLPAKKNLNPVQSNPAVLEERNKFKKEDY